MSTLTNVDPPDRFGHLLEPADAFLGVELVTQSGVSVHVATTNEQCGSGRPQRISPIRSETRSHSKGVALMSLTAALPITSPRRSPNPPRLATLDPAHYSDGRLLLQNKNRTRTTARKPPQSRPQRLDNLSTASRLDRHPSIHSSPSQLDHAVLHC